MIGIYKITSPSGKVYIGQSVNIRDRKYQYKSSFKNRNTTHLGPKLYNSFIKYGYENHIFEIIEECLLEQLNEKEIYYKQHYIDLIGWKNVLFCELYDNGGGPRSEETKQKISKSNLGKKVSQETRIKKSTSMMGKTHTKETKEKMSKSSLGKKKSQEHIDNMMKNRINVIKGIKESNSKPVYQIDIKNNKIIKEYISVTEAKKEFKGDIGACCRGRQKTACGFVWKFKQ